jgi:hypothetical protein
MGGTSRALRSLGILFFSTHIGATMLVDAQALLPPHIFPVFAKNMLRNFLEQYNDPLMSTALSEPRDQRWFQSLVASEIALQLPFFFVALYAFIYRKEWIRRPMIAYGGFVSATMVPILTELFFAAGITSHQRGALLAMYLPYLVVPVVLVLWGCSGAECLFEHQGKVGHGKNKNK